MTDVCAAKSGTEIGGSITSMPCGMQGDNNERYFWGCDMKPDERPN